MNYYYPPAQRYPLAAPYTNPLPVAPLLPPTGYPVYPSREPSRVAYQPVPSEGHRQAGTVFGHSHSSHHTYASQPIGNEYGNRGLTRSYSIPTYYSPPHGSQGVPSNRHTTRHTNVDAPTHHSQGGHYPAGRQYTTGQPVPQAMNLRDSSRQSGHHYHLNTQPGDYVIIPPHHTHHTQSRDRHPSRHYHSPNVVNLDAPLEAHHAGPTVCERMRRFFGFGPEHYANYVDARTGRWVDWRGRPIYQL